VVSGGEDAGPLEHTSRYGPTFWTCLAIGTGCMVFGLTSLFANSSATDPVNFAGFFVGLVLVHDMLVVPATIVAAWLLRSVAPAAIRGTLSGALAVSAIVVAFSIPLLAGWGAQPDNTSLLPRRYGLGLSIVLAWVWLAWLAVALARRRGSR
jgi:hypothetical protein